MSAASASASERPEIMLGPLTGCLLTGRRRRRRRARRVVGLRDGAGSACRGGVLRLRRVLAVLRDEAGAAVRLVLPLLAEVLDEAVERLLLVLRRQQLLDRLVGLLEGLLRGRRDLLDLEDVVAELRLDRPDELALLGLEDRLVERLLLLALGDGEQDPALALGGLVDGELLGHRLERSAARDLGAGLRGLGLVLGQDNAQ